MKTWCVSVAAFFGLIASLWASVEALDGRYAAASDVQNLALDIYYGQFFDHLDRIKKARDQRDLDELRTYTRQAQRVLAKICHDEPDFEYCQTGVPGADGVD